MAMVSVAMAMAMHPIVAMPIAPTATATGLGKRRAIIGSITIGVIIPGQFSRIARFGRNGRGKRLQPFIQKSLGLTKRRSGYELAFQGAATP
jgi:hypothetical protein